MKKNIDFLKKLITIKVIIVILSLFWTALILGLIIWSRYRVKDFTQELALHEAESHFNKDHALRIWAASHGGVYVPIDSTTPPSPYLTHIEERDIITPAGVRLTLMNPDYIMRQLNERFSEYYGVVGHITSLKPIRPQNSPDEWERRSLESFEHGNKQVVEYTEINSKTFLRLIQPLVTEKECLKCHQEQGYKSDDIRGGISISLPMSPLLEKESKIIKNDTFSFIIIWLIGISGLYFGSKKVLKSEKEIKNYDKHLEDLINQQTDGLIHTNLKLNEEILEHKITEETLKESEKTFREIFNKTDVAMLVQDPITAEIYDVNDAFSELFGYSRQETLNLTMAELSSEILSQSDEIARLKVQNANKTGNDTSEWIFKKKDYTLFWVEVTLKHAEIKGKKRSLATIKDITKRKLSEQLLKDSEEKYKSIFDNASIGICHSSLDGSFLMTNKTFENISGYSQDELKRLTFNDITHPDDLNLDQSKQKKMLDNEIQTYSIEKRYIHKDGHIIWIKLTVSLIRGYKKEPEYFVGIIEDISKKIETEQNLELRSTQLEITNEQLKEEIKERKINQDNLFKNKIILDSIYEGVFTINEDNIITTYNASANIITNYSSDEAIGQFYNKIFNLNDPDPVIIETIRNRLVIKDRSTYLIKKSGEIIPVQISTSILKSSIGFGKEYAIAFRDMSQIELLQKELKKGFSYNDMISKNPKMQKIFSILPAVSLSDSVVLIEGPTGTGKDLLASAIHNLSNRKNKQYIIINCGAIPPTLIESELFGHVKGAFTDAKYSREGKILSADGGTLFLDEIAEIPMEIQSKLLRLLQNFEIQKVGLDKPIKVDVRIIAATNQNLKIMIQERKFREDLYHRLNTIKFNLPPLSERKEDLPYLIEHFIAKNNAKYSKKITGLSPEAMRLFLYYSFPGNIRELEKAIEFAFIICDKSIIDVHHLPEDMINSLKITSGNYQIKEKFDIDYRGERKTASNELYNVSDSNLSHFPKPLENLSEVEEKERIISTILKYNGNKSKAARELNIHYTTLWKKIKKYKIT